MAHDLNTKEGRNSYMKEWFSKLPLEVKQKRNLNRTLKRQQKKSDWVAFFGGICLDCKQSFPDCVFEFHHVDPTTKIHTDPSKVFMFSDVRIKEELDKCIMLCANCHRIRHHSDKYVAHNKRKKYALPNP
jgi:hypothetical protein